MLEHMYPKSDCLLTLWNRLFYILLVEKPTGVNIYENLTRAKIYYLGAWANNHFLDTCVLTYTYTHPNLMWFPSIQLNFRSHRWYGFNPRVRKIPWRRKWQHTPVFLPGKSHGQRSLAGYSPWGHTESDTTEATEHAHTGTSVDGVLTAFILWGLAHLLKVHPCWGRGQAVLPV